MIKEHLIIFGLVAALSVGATVQSFADVTNGITMETSGVYLFKWRPVDRGDGVSFVILIDDNTVNEGDAILSRGYDYVYTFEPVTYSRPWGTAPDLVNVSGVWGIPENWSSSPEGNQPIVQIVLKTNHKNLDTGRRHVYVVHLPGSVNSSTLPTEVRKYLINVDSSDTGAYEGTETNGWIKNENGQWTYRKSDGLFVISSWPTADEKAYYMGENGTTLVDIYAPDGIYVNPGGAKVSYKPGQVSDDNGWRYIRKNGYCAVSAWLQDSDGKCYCFSIGAYMAVDTTTPDGYRIDASGIWDGQASTIVNEVNLGPGMSSADGWELVDTDWEFRQEGGTYVTSAWRQVDGNRYYFGENSLTVTDQTTPDGYYVNADGVWEQ